MIDNQDRKTRTVSFHEQVQAMRRLGVYTMADTLKRTEVRP